MSDLAAGTHVVWSFSPRGGYGYVFPIDAVVVKINAKTIRIRVKTKSGTEVERNVRRESLRVSQYKAELLPGEKIDFRRKKSLT